MPQDSYINRHNTICAALRELENYPVGSKRPSVNSVAKNFGLSEATLRRAVKNGSPPNRQGPPAVLTNHEEEQLVGYCINMQKLGFGLTKSGINHCVMKIMHHQNKPHPFGEKGPGQDWWARFMRDHPELSFRTPQELSEARAQRANATIVKDHFKKLKQVIDENSLTALQIWNMDETGFILASKLEKVIAKKGTRQVHKVAHGSSHEHISVAPTISAAGTYIPPMLIYKGIRAIPNLLKGAPPGTVMGFSNSGYMCENLFQMYLNHFIDSIPSNRPVLLILDGHKSHVSYTSVDFCYKNGILLYALPPHTTHILQPSEIPFAKLKGEYRKGCDKYHNNTGKLVIKHTFTEVFGPAFIETYTPSAICNAFRATGIWPFNPDAINPDRLNPSLITERFDIPSQRQSSTQPIEPSLQLSNRPSQFYSTRSSTTQLKEENRLLKNENESLKLQLATTKEKLDMLGTYKNPGTSSLHLVLKYMIHAPRPEIPEDPSENQAEPEIPAPKRRKTLPFARLLTNEESLQQLKMINEETERKIAEKNQKKELAAQKKVARELTLMQKREERERKKREKEEQAQKKTRKRKPLCVN